MYPCKSREETIHHHQKNSAFQLYLDSFRWHSLPSSWWATPFARQSASLRQTSSSKFRKVKSCMGLHVSSLEIWSSRVYSKLEPSKSKLTADLYLANSKVTECQTCKSSSKSSKSKASNCNEWLVKCRFWGKRLQMTAASKRLALATQIIKSFRSEIAKTLVLNSIENYFSHN